MEIVLVVVVLIALGLGVVLARERGMANVAKERAESELASLRADLTALRAQKAEADTARRQLEEEAATASAARSRAETALAQERQATLERIDQAQRMRRDLEAQVAAARSAKNSAEARAASAESGRASAEAALHEAVAGREAMAAARDEAERVAAEAGDRLRAAEEAQAGLEQRVAAADDARAEAEASMTRLFEGGTDEAVARALWEAEVERADRTWRASIAPMVLAEAPDPSSTAQALNTTIAHELERLREEVGVSTELRGSIDVDPEPLVALVALRSAQELVAETSRHCNSVDVTLAGGERLAITVSGEGFDGSGASLRGIGTLVALASGEVTTGGGADGSMTTVVHLPLPAPAPSPGSDDG